MRRDLQDAWHRIAGTFAVPFRPLASRIASRPSDDFELLWLMADFAQLCVRYPALLLLSYGYHHPSLRSILFEELAPESLGRATLGVWVRFLRASLASLRLRGSRMPFDGLDTLEADTFGRIHRLVEERNELAHGALGRYEASEARANALGDLVLSIANALERVCSRDLTLSNGGFHWTTTDSGLSLPLHPFIVRSSSDDDPLLYDSVDGEAVVFTSRSDRVQLGDAEIAATIRHYLSRPPAGSLLDATHVTGVTLLARSRILLDALRAETEGDFFVTERCFASLPPFAGRPTLARYLSETVASVHEPLVLHLHGPRGSGKRRFMLDFLQTLAADKHVVVPIAARAAGEPGAFNAALGVSGDARDLVKAVERHCSGRRLVLVVSNPRAATGTAARLGEIQALADLCRRTPAACLLLVSDVTNVAEVPGLEGIGTAMPMPPMESISASAFYSAVTSTRGRAPLTEWEMLPAAAAQVASSPADLVSLCEVFNGLTIDEDFHVPSYRRRMWQSLVERSTTPDVGAFVAGLARRMRSAARRELTRAEPYEGVPNERRKAVEHLLETLWRTGYLVVDETVRFADFEWLARALVLTLPPQGVATMSEKDLAGLIGETAGFTPLGDALAEWVADAPANELARVFRAALSGPGTSRSRLVQALVVRAYAHADPRLMSALVDEALQGHDEAVCRGCAAAAQQLTQEGDAAAVRAGCSLFDRCLRTARARGFATLEAVLWNEHAEYVAAAADLPTREESYRRAADMAHSLGLNELEHVASNNAADVALQRFLQAPAGERAASEAEVRRLIDSLTGRTGASPNRENWTRLQATHELLAMAFACIGDRERWPEHARQAVEMAREFGSLPERARAHDKHAMALARAGDFERAAQEEREAVRLARMAAQPQLEADYERRTVRLLLAHARVSPAEAHRLWMRGLAHCRSAKRALEHLPSTSAAVSSAKGIAWRDMADLFDRLGNTVSAVEAARRSLEAFRHAGDEQQCRSLSAWIDAREASFRPT